MKDRLLTFGLALGALAAFYYFFIGPPALPRDEASRPLSTEARANGYLGVRRWIESHGIGVADLRQRFDALERDPSLPERGNLLITTIPYGRDAREWEFDSLRRWIARGNTVLVAGGMFDTPEWAVPERNTLRDMYLVTRLRFADPEPDEESPEGEAAEEDTQAAQEPPPQPAQVRKLDEPKRGSLVPVGAHPLTEGVASVAAVSEYPAGKFVTRTPPDAAMLALMRDQESGQGAFWLTWVGEGTVVVSGYGSVFTNKMLGEADNARLLSNVIALYLAPDGRVVFDDIHQGAASFYDAEAFFADPRLHATAWWVVGLWFLWVLGATRLAPPRAGPAPVREEAFLAATGNFFARVLDRRRAAARLFAHFRSALRPGGAQDAAAPPWEWMRGVATVEPALLARVEAQHRRVAAGKRVDLARLHNDLRQLWKQLQ